MAKCDYCGTTILFGGVRADRYRFCNRTCQRKGYSLAAIDQIPEDYLREQVRTLHQAACPRCQGPGPVDVHTSHRIWSALVLTTWSSRPHICCRQCGRLEQVKDSLLALLLGWWGFPWGLLVTPIQIVRNLVGLCSGPSDAKPSDELYRLVQINIGARILQSRQ
ncbi:MAG: hypothetical protein KME45_19740 [Stenomitos rutilans HA7619-LM2]|jgi:hypothetical protein|nr:hypothetical protein [Stenomitos rutilans HA7619-LM2]